MHGGLVFIETLEATEQFQRRQKIIGLAAIMFPALVITLPAQEALVLLVDSWFDSVVVPLAALMACFPGRRGADEFLEKLNQLKLITIRPASHDPSCQLVMLNEEPAKRLLEEVWKDRSIVSERGDFFQKRVRHELGQLASYSSELAQAYRIWADARGSAEVLRFSDAVFTRIETASGAEFVNLLDVTSDDPANYRYLVMCGRTRALLNVLSEDPEIVGSIRSAAYREKILEDYSSARNARAPVFHELRMELDSDIAVTYVRLILPFGENGRIDRLAICVAEDRQRSASDVSPVAPAQPPSGRKKAKRSIGSAR